MAICLVSDDLAWSVQIPLEDQVVDAVLFQLQRAEEGEDAGQFRARLLKWVAPALLEALDPDLKPPTSRQLSYARVLSRRLGVAIPAQAERNRTAMAEFLKVHVPQLKKRPLGQ